MFFKNCLISKNFIVFVKNLNLCTIGKLPRTEEANARYNSKFVEVKVRMTPDRRSVVQEHAAAMDESTTAFINRAIDETMARDQEKNSGQ